jgi:hypothetical protein
MVAVEGVQGDSDLMEIILASGPIGGFPDFLDSRQEQANQNTDDRDHDQKFDEGKTWLFLVRNRHAGTPFNETEILSH